jgi:hypothetical protein
MPTFYKGDNSGRGPSPGLWADCPFTGDPTEDTNLGYHFWDDFISLPVMPTVTTVAAWGPYNVYNTDGTSVQTPAFPAGTVYGGGIFRHTANTAGDAMVIGTASCPFVLKSKKLWFEARIATTSIATNDGQLFLGLAENYSMTFGAATPLADANATANTGALIGFNRLEDGLAVVNTSYADHATSWTNVKASAYAALAANTWLKLGIRYDPNNAARAITFFVNGVELDNAVTQAILTATTYLDNVGFGPCFAFFVDTAGTASYGYLDWWRCAQLG